MTVSTSANSVVYRGNGAATEFAVPFKVLDEDHLVVRRRVFATGIIAYTYIGTDYSYDGVGDDSGTLTLDGTALDDDYELVIERIVPYTQDLDIVNAGGFYPETVEQQLDFIAMGMQQVANLAGRGLVVPVGEDGLTIPRTSNRTGGYVLGFHTTTGDAIAVANSTAAVASDLEDAEAAVIAAQTAEANAEIAEANAEIAETAAEAAQLAAEGHELAAETAADQAAVYLEGIIADADEIYDDEPTGRAAVANGEKFWVVTGGVLLLYERIDAGSVSTLMFSDGGLAAQPIVICTPGGTGNAITLAPKTGFTVTGTDQMFVFKAAASNSAASPTIAAAGINGGAAAVIVMPNADPAPIGQLTINQWVHVHWNTSTSKWVLVHPNVPQASVVMCNQTAGTGNAITATIAHAGTKFRTDLNDTLFGVRVTATAGPGAKSIAILKPDGSTLIAATTVFQKDGVTAPPTLAWETNDTIWIRRLASGFFALADGPSSEVRTVSTTYPALGDLGQRGSTIRPLMYAKAGDEKHFIDLRLHEDKYLNGQSRRQSDMLRIVLDDMANFQSIDGNLLSINSLMTRARGRSLHDLNMQFTELIGGIVTNTGRSPTTIEPPIHGGKFGDAANLYVIAGAGHGSVDEPVSVVTGTYADASTGEVDTDVVIDPDAVIGYRFSGDKLVVETEMLCVNAADDIWCVQSHTMTLDPIATDQLRVQSEYDFDHADVTVTPGFIRGFGMLWAMTDVDRCQPIVNGVAQAIEIIDLRDDSENTIGFPEQVVFWHSDFPEKQIIVTNNFGYGFTHKENGVSIANDVHQAYIANGPDYVKLYSNLFGDHAAATTRRDMTGIVVTQDFGVRVVLADPRV